ncbi:MAG TPA: BON domain-containing protein [Thermoanaerobaculia bacterium]|nr:BON domain-containing protein [Thermoanaerobaculia bacterium]
MKKRFHFAASVAGAFLLLCAAACRPNQTIERQTDDAGIKTSIKAKLASDVRFSTLTAVAVDVTNGVVTLAGPVHNEDEKAKIEETVRSVKGVSGVNNNLQIQAESVAAANAVTPSSGAPPSGAPPAPAMTPTPTPTPAS